MNGGENVPFLLELVLQINDLELDFALRVVLEDVLVRLAQPVALLKVLRVGRGVVAVARPHVGEVALDVARGAAAARRREADVAGHGSVGLRFRLVGWGFRARLWRRVLVMLYVNSNYEGSEEGV